MDNDEIPKAYEAKQYEDEIYATWEKSGFFNPDNLPGKRTESFTIVLPPPNVTGTLHMGHAVMLAIEDIMTRFNRMRGKKALWIPGTDHAAIATQAKVEKLLMKEGMKDPRHELGREKFLDRVRQFATESHDVIVNQSKKMGASLDWSREAYTLDEARNHAVNTVFKMMHDDGLIYRGDRIVNWCPRCKSTLADDEVEYREEKSKFYYFKYGPVVIGTARPETKFLDKVIIVHPDDDRYKDLVGKEMDVEWIEGTVKAKMVADKAADMEIGSGAMTITPAHSFVDFDLAKKYNFEIHKIIDEDGNLTEAAGSFAGKNAQAVRKEVVEVLKKKGLVDRIDEDYVHNLSVCYRCDTAVEPLPKVQWFIDVNKPFKFRASEHAPIDGLKDGQEVTLKQLMQHVVRTDQVEIIPDRFNKTYFHWIDNLRDWNISRQIWFGHRVPVWYKGEETFVGTEAPEGDGWEQDPDTLDTWFSSGLWTFSTLGWPDKKEELKTFHPTSVLETGYDILFFWVARMILMTTYTLGEIPFKHVYLHGLIRDEQGRKMSKSLDNVIDPLDMISKFGADATRLSLVIGMTPGNDSRLSEQKVAGYRNFTNKLWNISRFVLGSVGSPRLQPGPGLKPEATSKDDIEAKTLADRWILSRFHTVAKEVTDHLEAYEYSQAGEKLRDFTWNEFADWYLEIAKIQKGIGDLELGTGTDKILLYVIERLLTYWHPFMPFVTEEIWKQIDPESMLMIHEWPLPAQDHKDKKAEEDFYQLKEIITSIRNIRAIYNIPANKQAEVGIWASGDAAAAFLRAESSNIQTLSKADPLEILQGDVPTDGVVSSVVGRFRVFVTLTGLVDIEKEKIRIGKEIKELKDYLTSVEKKLENTDFRSKAPDQVIQTMAQKKEEASRRLLILEEQYSTL